MKILFITNVASPYRVDFFNELGKYSDLTVLFEKRKSDERGNAWDGYQFLNFKGVFLHGKSINTDTAICPGVVRYVKDRSFDHIICANFTSPTGMIAIEYMRLHGIHYWLESDGGFAKDGKGIKEKLKKHFIAGAKGYFSTAREHDKYYLAYGAPKELLYRYPFTSLKREDLMPVRPSDEEKTALKKILGIKEEKCIISVGRFSYLEGTGKGFDTLLNMAEQLDNSIGVYIIADTPTDEFLRRKEAGGEKLSNLHFIDYMKKNVLFQYYRAADIFMLLTRGEAWGLVINEAMAHGLPVITTSKCVAGMELVKNGENGYIIEPGNETIALESAMRILDSDELREKMSRKSIAVIADYTIENMSEIHLKTLFGGGGVSCVDKAVSSK